VPSPFPGMDPWLEGPPWWGEVHHALIHFAWQELNAILPKGYVANVGERVYVVHPEREIEPDVAVAEQAFPRPPVERVSTGALVADPPVILSADPLEVEEPFLEIVRLGKKSRIVTAIEILSPANKKKTSPGRKLYSRKQRQLLKSRTHLLEIDLLRGGNHTCAVPESWLEPYSPYDYLASLHRARAGNRFGVWFIQLRNRVPCIQVPLLEDESAVLDLQALLSKAYDVGSLREQIDYRRDPRPALRKEDREWTDDLLRQEGLR
jgi:hypothetical protein